MKINWQLLFIPPSFKTPLQMQSIRKKAAGETAGEQSDEIPISGSFLYPATLQDQSPTPLHRGNSSIPCYSCAAACRQHERKLLGGDAFTFSYEINDESSFPEQPEAQRGPGTCWPSKYIISHIFLLNLLLQVLAMWKAKSCIEKGKIQDASLCPKHCRSKQRESCGALS